MVDYPVGDLIAVAMPVCRRKQSARLAATLNSPPLTWIWHWVAFRKGMMPGSRRWTRAPSDTRSSAAFLGTFRLCFMAIYSPQHAPNRPSLSLKKSAAEEGLRHGG